MYVESKLLNMTSHNGICEIDVSSTINVCLNKREIEKRNSQWRKLMNNNMYLRTSRKEIY
jgi:hypothetical protein